MKLLDYNVMPSFLQRWFGSPEQHRARLVGPARDYDSGYYDIVRFFGEGFLNPDRIALRYEFTPITIEDPLIQRYARRTEAELRQTGRLYDGPQATAVVEEAFDEDNPHVTLRPCDYGLFAGSCFALDRPASEFAGKGETLREYYASKYPGRTRDRHPLAGTLGVCGLLVLRDRDNSRESILFVRRAGHLASLENSVGPSAAGSVDWGISCRTLRELTVAAMSGEVIEELGLRSDEFSVRPLAYAREIFRGEKPQLFAVIESVLNRADIEARIGSVEGRREFDDYRFVSIDRTGALPTDERAQLNHEARMNLALVEELRAAERN